MGPPNPERLQIPMFFGVFCPWKIGFWLLKCRNLMAKGVFLVEWTSASDPGSLWVHRCFTQRGKAGTRAVERKVKRRSVTTVRRRSLKLSWFDIWNLVVKTLPWSSSGMKLHHLWIFKVLRKWVLEFPRFGFIGLGKKKSPYLRSGPTGCNA